MDRIIKLIIVLAVIVCGCIISPGDLQFTADIDGSPYRAIAGWWEETIVEGFSMGQIIATDINGCIFTIFVNGPFEEKTYSLGFSTPDKFEAYATYTEDLIEGTIYLSQSGTLTILSKKDGKLSGSFELTLTGSDDMESGNTLEVENGRFDLPNTPITQP